MTYRSFIPGRIYPAAERIWLTDWWLPLALTVDARTAVAGRLVGWEPVPELAGWPAVADLVAAEDGAWVAAPSAGGLVRLTADRAEVVPLPVTVARLAAEGPYCWAASEYSSSHRDEGGQVWRVGPDGSERVEIGGRSSRIAVRDGSLYALVRRDDDTPVEEPHPGGGSTMHYPGALVRVDPDGRVEVVVEFDDLPAQLVWASGHLLVAVGYELREVDLEAGRLGEALEIPPPNAPLGTPIDLGPHHIADHAITDDAIWVRTHDPVQRAREDGRVVRATLPWTDHAGGDSELVAEGSFRAMAVRDGALWATRCLAGDGPELVRVDTSNGHLTQADLDGVDLWPYLPQPRPPRQIDPVPFAAQQRVALEEALRQIQDPPVGLSLTSVVVRKDFPETELVAVWGTVDSVGGAWRLRGRSWRVFDAAGNIRRLAPAHLVPADRGTDDGAVEMTVFACAVCAAAITRPVELLEPPPVPPDDPLGGDGANWVPIGRWLRGSDADDIPGGPLVNEEDLSGTQQHPEGIRSAGCCGPDGSRGPNITCANGHEVAVRFADCYQVHRVQLLSGAIATPGAP